MSELLKTFGLLVTGATMSILVISYQYKGRNRLSRKLRLLVLIACSPDAIVYTEQATVLMGDLKFLMTGLKTIKENLRQSIESKLS